MECTDSEGKPRYSAPNSKTGLCHVCLSNLSQARKRSHAKQLRYDRATQLRVNRSIEKQRFPNGYAKLGGRNEKLASKSRADAKQAVGISI